MWRRVATAFILGASLGACNVLLGNEPLEAGVPSGAAASDAKVKPQDPGPPSAPNDARVAMPEASTPLGGSEPSEMPDAKVEDANVNAGMSTPEASVSANESGLPDAMPEAGKPEAGTPAEMPPDACGADCCMRDEDCARPNVNARCEQQRCQFVSCVDGYVDCRSPAGDCESKLGTSEACTSCEDVCRPPNVVCSDTLFGPGCVTPAFPLLDFAIELGCIANIDQDLCSSYPPSSGMCPEGGRSVLHNQATFGGTAGEQYDVELHILGVVEPRTYEDGVVQGDHWMVGGRPTRDGMSGYNVYSLTVSNPPQTYYLNHDPLEEHRVFVLDHRKHVRIAAGAIVELKSHDLDCAIVRNCTTFPGENCVPLNPGPNAQAFNGQQIRLEVVNVTTVK